MKQLKNTAILALCALFMILSCVLVSCEYAAGGEDTTAEITYSLDDFVYDTEIDRDHVITEQELAAMNRLWLSEFGKEFAETPEDAMKRVENGNFYFGRYGKTFVFYRKQYNMDMKFSWGRHDFVFPWGEFYFLNGEKVYTREEIVLTELFTDEHIDALYDCCTNYYPAYVPEINLPEGDHVLTAKELAEMQEVFDGAVAYSKFATLESAMRRTRNSSYYFGKFGDTFIFWVGGSYRDLADGFEWGGYNFDFSSGRLYLYENRVFYDHISAVEGNIMTADEIKDFYEHYVNRFVPFNSLPYTCPVFINGVEKLTDAEMRSINEAYEAWKYEQEYNRYYDYYIEAKYSVEKAEESADNAATRNIGYDPHRFFNEEKNETYQYYGKRENKVFLAVQNEYAVLTVIEITGYKFVLDGSGCDLVVCIDGEITPLAEAYEKGTVSADDVAFAHERHLAYSKYLLSGREEIAPPARLKLGEPRKESPIGLTDEEVREIVWEYIAGSREEELQYTYGVRCYGKFDGAYAVMIDGPFMYTQEMRSESVAGYSFIFNNGQRLKIYKEGDFYSLRKAYELGIVTEENIASIEWTKVAPYTYTKTTAPVELTEEEIVSILSRYTEYGASHGKDAVYSIRCYGKTKRGYAVFIDCSDKSYNNIGTVEKVGEYEFKYPTEQTLLFIYAGSEKMSIAKAFEYEMIDEAALKAIYETYRAAHTELYN